MVPLEYFTKLIVLQIIQNTITLKMNESYAVVLSQTDFIFNLIL